MPRSCRLFLVVLLVRMWRLNACERLIEPLPRTRKRFFAPDLVFIFGMMPSPLFAAHRGALRACGERLSRPCGAPASGLVRVMRLRQRLLRGQQHHHLPALQPRKLLDRSLCGSRSFANPFQQAHTEFLVRHLAPAEPQRDLGLVAFAQEPDEVAQLDLVIAFVSVRAGISLP